jgi:hypothetical protein
MMRYLMLALGFCATAAAAEVKTAKQTEEQKTALAAALNSKLADPDAQKVRSELAPNLTKLLNILACYSQLDIGNFTKRFFAPNVSDYVVPVTNGMNYHDRATCLSVERIDGWSMSAKNAVKMRVVFVADDSGESAVRNLEWQKQSDDVWLLRYISP